MRAARAAQLFFHTRPIKFLIYGVVVAVPVVDAKTPQFCSPTDLDAHQQNQKQLKV